MKLNRPSPTCIVTSSGPAGSQWFKYFSFYPAATKVHYCKVSLAKYPCPNVLRRLSCAEPSVQMPEVTPLLGAMHAILQDEGRPVVISSLTAPKKGNLSTLIVVAKAPSAFSSAPLSARKCQAAEPGISFSPGKSVWGSLARSHRLADHEPRQVTIVLRFFQAEMNGLA